MATRARSGIPTIRARNGFVASWWREKLRSAAIGLLLLGAPAPHLAAQLAPPSTGGIVELNRLLQQLAEPRRVLVIGAHPDDEDTALLTLMARGYGAEAAYLALSRGDGGQNLIGDQLGEDLGVIRTGELESARSVDGARQFFTRAFDFGYTRSLEETERFWLPDSVLKDVVRIVRRFRPHVMVPVFSGTRRDGHGQHQMAGVVARRAFAVAGDPAVFPELLAEEGLEPWTPLKLYGSARFNRATATLTLSTGGLDPVTGLSYLQIALASRSRHRSQDFGTLQRTGPGETRLQLVETRAGTNGTESDLFDGIPRNGGPVAAFADSLRLRLSPARLDAFVAPIAEFLGRAQGARPASVAEPAVPDRRTRRLHEALAIAAGIVFDVRSPDPELVSGQDVAIEATLYNAGLGEVRVFAVAVHGEIGGSETLVPLGSAVAPGTQREFTLPLTVRADARPTRPYFLAAPRAGALYDWSDVPPPVRGEPFGPPVLTGEILLDVAGAWVRLSREVTYRWADQAIGEIREPVRVVPLVDVRLEPAGLVWPARAADTEVLTVSLRSNADGPVAGTVTLRSDGWRDPAPQPFSMERNGETRQLTFRVRRPPGVEAADVTVRAVAETDDGHQIDEGTWVLAYEHIRPRQMVRHAVSHIRVADIALPAARSIGYVRGASDRVPEALRGIGVEVELLDAQTLAGGDLSRFDVIVIGARAYETDTALVRHNDRLLTFARDGGHLVVQYQQYAFVRGEYAPFPLDIARPHDRITDETSPVVMLDPAHRLFNGPNRIADGDWDGWPQERGLYFANTWDAAYTPLLEMQDPDRDPIRGGLLVAPVGRGTYVYTGLSFFRALPAGTIGAFRLFMNLLDMGRTDVP